MVRSTVAAAVLMGALLASGIGSASGAGADGPPAEQATDEALAHDDRGRAILPLEVLLRDPATGEEDRAAYQEGILLLQERHWAAAAEAFSRLATRLPAAEVHYGAAVAWFEQERYDRAEAHLRSALAGGQDDVRAANLMGLTLSAQGHAAEAMGWFDRCLGAARREGNTAFEGYALLNAAIAALEGGDAAGARRRAELALEIGEAGRYGNVRAAAWNTLGNVELHAGNRARAEELYRASLKLERKGKGSGARAVVLSNLAQLLAASGRGADSIEWFDQALAEARQRKERAIEASVLVTSAAVLADLGRAEEASARLEDAARVYGEIALPRGLAEVRMEQARQALHRGDAAGAGALVAEVDGILAALDLPVEKADARFLAASARALAGDVQGARADARAAEEGYVVAGTAEGVARALGLQADLARDGGDLAGAEGLYRRALETYVRSGLRTGEAELRGRLAHVLVRSGRVVEGVREAEGARAAMEGAGLWAALAAFEDEIGVSLDRVGQLEEALGRYGASVRAAGRAGREDLARHAERNRASALLRLGRLDEAEAAAAASGDAGIVADVAWARAARAYRLGVAEVDARRADAAEGAFREAGALAPAGEKGEEIRRGARAGMAAVYRLRAQAAQAAGDVSRAGEAFTQAVLEARQGRQDRVLATALWDLGTWQAESGDREGARILLAEAVEAARRVGDRATEARLRLLTGNTLVEDDASAAMEEYAAAAEIAARLPDGSGLEAKALYNLGVLRLRADRVEEGVLALRGAREIFARSGEAARVKEVDALLASAGTAGTAREAEDPAP